MVDTKKLEEKAKDIRRHVLQMTAGAGSGHPGGSLSCVEVIVSLYFHRLAHKPDNPDWEDRDRVVMCKGHAAPALYAALAESGYFPVEELKTLREFGSPLQGHPEMRRLKGVEVSTGSLGQGLSVATGVALAGKLDSKSYRIYAILGDGECDEGQVWEAAMAAAHYKLDNLTAIIDRNGLQIDGPTEKVMSLEPLSEKWRAFGWHVIEVEGHNFAQILDAFDEAESVKGRPTAIIGHIIKGKGISFMEWVAEFHGRPPTEEELKKALEELC